MAQSWVRSIIGLVAFFLILPERVAVRPQLEEGAVGVEDIQQSELNRLAIVADHLGAMARGVKPEDSIVGDAGWSRGFGELNLVRSAAICIAVALNPGGEAAIALARRLFEVGRTYGARDAPVDIKLGDLRNGCAVL